MDFRAISTQALALLTLTATCGYYGVDAQQPLDVLQGNGAVRGYDADNTAPTMSTTAVQMLSESQPTYERATLGSPAVLVIVVGCVVAVAVLIAITYRTRSSPEPSTPRDDEPVSVEVVSTKAICTEYQQSFDQPKASLTSVLEMGQLEPHSPKMPPPHRVTSRLAPTQQQFAPRSSTDSAPQAAPLYTQALANPPRRAVRAVVF